MTNHSIREDLISDSFSSTSTSNSSPSSQSLPSNIQPFYTSSFNSCTAYDINGVEEARSERLSDLFKKSEHQLGDTNFKFIKYNPRVTSYLIIISSILTLAVFAYMILFREQMFIFSLEFIEDMQANRNIVTTSLMNFISLCVSPKPVISLLVLFFAMSTQKLKILTFLIYYGFLVYTCMILKSTFGDPRPYWIESQIEVTTTEVYVNQQNNNRILQFKDPLNSDTIIYGDSPRQEKHKDYFTTTINNFKHESNIQSDQKQSNFNKMPENIKPKNTLIFEESYEPEINLQDKTKSDNNMTSQKNNNMQNLENEQSIVQNQKVHVSNDNIQESRINNDKSTITKFNENSKKHQPKDYQQHQQQSQEQIIRHNQFQQQILSDGVEPTSQDASDKKNINSKQINPNKDQEIDQYQNKIDPNNIQNLSIHSTDASVLPLDWKCYQEFGNPSGHAFLGVPLYEFIVRDYILRKIGKDQRVVRTLIAICAVILVNLILISRMYLGMHSLNQVIFGCVLGIYATVFYRLFFERRISGMLYQFVQLKRSNATKQIIYLIVFSLILFSLPIVIYYLQENILNNSPSQLKEYHEWESVILQKCGNYDRMQSFHHKCFIDSSIVAIGFSIVLGFLLTSREKFLKGQYKEAPGLKNFIIRLCLILSICSIIAIFYYVLPNYNYPYLKYFYLFLGTFITGFLLVALVPKLFEKYSLITITYPLLQEQLNGLNQITKSQQQQIQQSVSIAQANRDFQSEFSNNVLSIKEMYKS